MILFLTTLEKTIEMTRFLQLIILLSFTNSSSAFITVGDDLQCDFSTISAALVQAQSNQDFELRVSSNTVLFDNIEIDGFGMAIQGGYIDCNAALNNIPPNGITKIDGSNLFKPVFVIENIGDKANQVTVKNFEIYNGLGNVINPSGGINIKDVDVQINLENLWLHDNNSEKGGAIYSNRFDSTGDLNMVLMKDVNMDRNVGTDGGGLYCTESDISIYGDSVIQSNQALGPGGGSREGHGGGVYATANCRVKFYSGNTGFTLGIVSNTANGNGGGIYASAAAKITLDGYVVHANGMTFGDPTNPVNVTNNITNFGDGAGVYLQGAGTQVTAFASIINFNGAAGSYGGGVAVLDSAQFAMLRKNENCWDNYLCNQISANKVFSSNGFPSYGGAVSAQTSAIVTIEQTIINSNQAEFGTIIAVDDSSVDFESVMAFKNGANGNSNNLQDNNAISVMNNSTVTIGLTSLVNNQVTQSVINNDASTIKLLSSIVQDSVDVLASNSAVSEQFECLLAHELASFAGTNINTTAATFVNQAEDDYHLQTGSVGIGLCSNSIFQADTNDIDNQLRTSLYDTGADNSDGVVDFIFINGFE